MYNENISIMNLYSYVSMLSISLLLVIGIIMSNDLCAQNGQWIAPKSANSYKNSLKSKTLSVREGKKLYSQFCAICHGPKGKGNGAAGMALKPRPSNFTKAIVQNQTDGAIFWKLTNGKAPMASYKSILTEEQRWHLVNYIRTFKK